MDFREIKVGNYYKTRSLGHVVKVKVTEKKKTENFYKLAYKYVTPNLFGFEIGWQFSETSNFPNVSAADL